MSAAAGRRHRLVRTQSIPRHREAVFGFFADASNLEEITPPFLRFRILTPAPVEMRTGARIDYALSLFGIPLRWRTRITEWEPGVRFVDEQESGPYAVWRHAHEFESDGATTLVRDVVDYSLPMGPLGSLAHVLFVERTLGRIFDFRREAIRRRFGPGESA
ncbi:MAG TPA: SRPBCC family protein [Thermoanaerobaculia bacterium]|nr:SRPBCC family protein [Thermoanaerobaculia bacterium]